MAQQCSHPAVAQFKTLDAGFSKQPSAFVERSRTGGHPHGLLLALVGQPMPHAPRFQQPLTLRSVACVAIPGLAALRRNKSLFSLGGMRQGDDVESPLGLFKIERQGIDGVILQAKPLLPELQRGRGRA